MKMTLDKLDYLNFVAMMRSDIKKHEELILWHKECVDKYKKIIDIVINEDDVGKIDELIENLGVR